MVLVVRNAILRSECLKSLGNVQCFFSCVGKGYPFVFGILCWLQTCCACGVFCVVVGVCLWCVWEGVIV